MLNNSTNKFLSEKSPEPKAVYSDEICTPWLDDVEGADPWTAVEAWGDGTDLFCILAEEVIVLICEYQRDVYHDLKYFKW